MSKVAKERDCMAHCGDVNSHQIGKLQLRKQGIMRNKQPASPGEFLALNSSQL